MNRKKINTSMGGGGKRLDYNDLAKSLGMLTILWGNRSVNYT